MGKEIDIKEQIYKLTDQEITEDKETELKKLLEPYKTGSIGIAQINTIVGDIEYNAEKIIKYIKYAQNIGVELVIFPQLTLIGQPIEDTIDKHPIIAEENLKWLDTIAKITTSTNAIIGFVEPIKNENGKYYNSAAIIQNGKIQNVIRKTSKTCTDHNDYRYIKNFEGENPIINISNKKYIITLDEECNITQNTNLNKDNSIIISCFSSQSRPQSDLKRHKILSNIAKKYSIPVIYINQVGATDSTSFEGLSSSYDSKGNLTARAKSFDEQLFIINPEKNLGKIYSYPNENSQMTDKFTLDYEYDLERTYKTIVQGIKDYFNKNGFKRAVLGLSGGLDSTVCAVLLADAIGAKNVYGISMPSKITSDESKTDAQLLAQNLGINFTQAPIKDMFETTNTCLQELFTTVEKDWSGRYKQSFTPDNIQARSRAMFLWCISNEFDKTLPIATSDKSEAYVGYATINGDMSGGFAPIADVTKTKLFALARWMNKNRVKKNVVPQSIIDKKPGAELAIDPKTGKALVAEDALMPYEFLDEIIWRLENKKENYQDMLNSTFLYEEKHNISKEQKTEWLDKFYRRNEAALYKKSILPPYVIVDSNSIKNYVQPISSHINYKGLTLKEIDEKISSY